MKLRLALPALALAACGGGVGGSTDVEPTLRFADRTDVEIARLINASVGSEMFQAQSQVDRFGDTFDPDPCPQLAISGQTATVTGGCTTTDGVTIGGGAVITNPIGWDQIDTGFGDDATYQLDDLSFTESGFTQRFDGVFTIAGDFRTWDADLTTEQQGIAVRSDIYLACSGSATRVTCTLGESGVELVGVGGALVSGNQRVENQKVSTDLTLRGADTLTVHVADNCIEWSISGTDRHQPQICP